MLAGCETNSTMTAHRQFQEAEIFADKFSKGLREAIFWSDLEYSDELIQNLSRRNTY